MKYVLLHNETGMTLGLAKGRIDLVHPSKRCAYTSVENVLRAQRVFAPDCVIMPESCFDGSSYEVFSKEMLELDKSLRRVK